ncbi:PEP-CTERM sorting domain-containing protein [Tautonia plasticadhaerens]|nr:PEP-CTERM sorting domain-containing protein [Tautonia plasticadhaerens]
MLEFFGSGGAYYARPLDGDEDVRDWLFSEYTNAINGTSTVEVFAAGSGFQRAYRLDMLTVELPVAFRTQTLDMIRVSDWGNYELQRLNVHGITITAVPEPSSLLVGLLGACLAGFGGWRTRRRMKT